MTQPNTESEAIVPGIFLSDTFLSDESLSPTAKIIFLLVKRDIEKSGKKFTANMTNPRLAQMTGVSQSTVQRTLTALCEHGDITIVSFNKKVKKKSCPNFGAIKGTRFIYLDKKLAGYRQRAINKTKRPMDPFYRYFVLEGRMSKEGYARLCILEQQREREAREEEELRDYQEAFRRWIIELDFEEIEAYEKEVKVAPGTYAQQKRDYLEHARQISELIGDGDDGLFD